VPALAAIAKEQVVAQPGAEGAVVERPPQKIIVKAGESIQAAVDRARPGDTIEVMPGVYKEEVKIDLDNITLRGITQDIAAGDSGGRIQRPVLDGEGKLSDGVLATGSNFIIATSYEL